MSGGVPAGELRDFASLMVDEVIAKVRVQLDAGESLSVADQRLMLEQLIVERKRLHATSTPPTEGRDADVERVARAMCVADGLDPDEHIVGGQATGFEDFGPLWQAENRSEGQLGLTDYTGLARAALQALGERP